MHAIRRTAYATALSIGVGATAACGGAGTTGPAASAVHARAASSAPASNSEHKTPAMLVSESQLKAAASLPLAEDPSLQTDPSSDHTGVVTLKYVVDVGGPKCTVFLNAVNESGLAYHSLAEVDSGYVLAGSSSGIQIETILTSYSSVANAQRVVDDTRASAKSCAKLHYTLNGQSLAMADITGMPLAEMGDDSTAIRASFSANSNAPMPMAADIIRVGTVVLGVYVYNDTNPSAVLRQVASLASAKLQFQETLWPQRFTATRQDGDAA